MSNKRDIPSYSIVHYLNSSFVSTPPSRFRFKMSPGMDRRLKETAHIASVASLRIGNILRSKTGIKVEAVELDLQQMLETVAFMPVTHRFSVRVDHNYVDLHMKLCDVDGLDEFESIAWKGLNSAFIAEITSKATELADRLVASSADSPVQHVELYVYFHSFALLNTKPVLAVFLVCE